MFNFRRHRELLGKIKTYFDQIGRSMELFDEATRYYLREGVDEHLEVLISKLHAEESGGDDLRRSIELEMYEKSLLPEFQGEVLMILDKIDKVISRAEAVMYMIQLEKIDLLHSIRKDMVELIAISVETYRHTVEAALSYLGDMKDVRKLAQMVDSNESIGDRLERKMIKAIFEEKISAGEKVLQKEIVVRIGSICDLCENALDTIVIASVKRKI